jgi:hypothetical protein
MTRVCALLTSLTILGMAALAWGDGPQDNLPDAVRRVPKAGIDVPPETRAELERGAAELQAAIDRLGAKRDATTTALLPDVQVFAKAVHDALVYHEFFAPQELTRARNLLREGQSRAQSLEQGTAPWTTQTGLVVRGYV